jgi:hypothetical protein
MISESIKSREEKYTEKWDWEQLTQGKVFPEEVILEQRQLCKDLGEDHLEKRNEQVQRL